MNARFCPFAVRLVILSFLFGTIGAHAVIGPPATIQFVNSTYGFFENQTNTIDLQRFGDTNVSCSVQWSFTGGTATPSSDFFGGSSTINFAAGQTFASLPIFIVDDSTFEADETANFALSSPVNATIGFPSNTVLTIYNDDVSNPPPVSIVQFIADTYGRNENTGDASLTVTRSGDTSNACSVNWSVTGGNASAGSDYTPASGTLNFAAFETFRNISLFIVDDGLVESNETVNLTLSGAINCTIGFPSNAVLTIFDNDVSNMPPANVDIAVGKTVNVSNAYVGQYVQFYLYVTNLGPNSASNIVVHDTLSPGLQSGGSAVFNFGEHYDSINGNWYITNLSVGAFTVLNVTAQVMATGTHSNTASLTSSQPPDTNSANNTGIATVVGANPSTDIAVGKTVNVSNAYVGQYVQFYLYVTNLGPNSASNIVVHDTLSPGLQPGGSAVFNFGEHYDSINGNWYITNLTVGAFTVLNVTAQVISTGTHSNTASLTSSQPTDTNSVNNTAVATVVGANPSTDIAVGKTVNVTNAYIGEYVQFYLYVTNLGPNIASNIVVREQLPAGLQSGGSAVFNSGEHYDSINGYWYITNMPVGYVTVLNVTAQVAGSGWFTNVASLNSSQPTDTNSLNNIGRAAVLGVIPRADIAVGKTANVTAVTNGGYIQFYLYATNLGPNIASNVVIREILPAGLQGAGSAVFNSGEHYDSINGYWYITNMPVGYVTTLNVTAQAVANGTHTNVASLNSSQPTDTNTLNNSGSVAVTVSNAVVQADLQITKTPSTSSVVVGSNVVFNLALRNLGPGTVTNQLVVTEVIPSGYDYVGDNSAGTGNYYSFGLGQWVMPTGIVAGATQAVAITLRANTNGVFTNFATIVVPSGVTDPNTNNNSSGVAVTNTKPQADLQMTKTANTNSVFVGSNVVFNLTLRNLGPDSVTNQIVVTEVVPPGFDFASYNTSAGIYSFGVGQWILPNGVNAGATQVLAITLRGATAGNYTNTAIINVPDSVNDPVTNNNSSSAVVTVSNVPTYQITGLVLYCMTNGPALTNVAIQLTGNGITNSTLTASNGSYMFTNLVAGSNYVLTPSLTNFTFLPTNLIVTVSSNATVTNFIGFTYTIRGKVTEGTNGPPLPGVLLVLTNGPQVRTNLTDTNGVYIFSTVPAGVWKLTPSTNGYSFVPTNVLVGLTNSLSTTNCTNVIDFVGLTKRIELIALEVPQVIQDWSNSVTLIRNKRTYVRAHVQLHTNTMPMTAEGFRLRGFRGGTELMPVQTPLNANPVLVRTNAVELRGEWTNSVNFVLPDTWLSGALELRFEWTNGTVIFREPAEVGGVPSNGAVRVSFVSSQVPEVKFFSISYTNDAGVTNMLTEDQERDLPKRVVSVFPIHRIDSAAVVPLMWPEPNPTARDVLLKMQRVRNMDRADTNRIYYGAIPRNGISGVAYVPGSAGAGFVPSGTFVEGRHTHSHEIAHSLGRSHTTDPFFGYTTNRDRLGRITSVLANGYCGETNPTNNAPTFPFRNLVNGAQRPTLGPMHNENAKIYGLDTMALDARIAPVVNPTQYFELMSYCSKNVPLPNLDEWPSSHTYEALRLSINSRFAPTPLAPVPIVKTSPQNLLHISGVIDFFEDSAQFFPFITAMEDTGPSLPPPGEYLFEMLDQNGTVILQIPFDPDDQRARGPESNLGVFFITILDNPAYKTARVIHDGLVLTSLLASPNAPTITVLSPNGGGSFGPGPITVSWVSQDADNEALTYDIQFSADNGQTWETLDMDWRGQTYTIDQAHLPGTVAGRFRVFATDKFHSAWDQSDGPFVIAGHPPTVAISTPGEGELFYGDQQIVFVADALDMEDGTLTGAAIQWSSSLDGALGAGELLTRAAADLSEGTHVITATATDSAGTTGSANVTIVVSRIEPPHLQIVLDGADAIISWPLSAYEAGYHLQRAMTLPGSWNNVANIVEVVEDRVQVRLPISGAGRFFRLIKP